MIYQLPNGRAVEMTIDQFLNMSDTDLHQLQGRKVGSDLSPFYDSALEDNAVESLEELSPETIEELDLEELPEEDLLELDLIDNGLKFNDLDFRCEEDLD